MIFNTGSGGNATRIVTGKSLYLADTAGGKYKNIKLVGASVQNGTPAVSKPVDIVSNKVKSITGCGKNLLQNTVTTKTDSGLTYTVNNGSVTINGTATGLSIVKIGSFKNTDKDLILSGCPKGGNTNTYKLSYYHESTQVNDFGSGVALPKNDITYEVRIVIYGGTTVNNLTFKPMIRLASDTDATYEPYTAITAELDQTYELNGIGGVKDTIESGKYIQRVGKIYSKNVSTVYTSSIANPNGNVYIIPCSSWEKEILWTHRNKGQSISTLTKNQYFVGQNDNSASGKVIYFISDATTTASALAEIQAENSEIYYILLNPIETALSYAELIALDKLRAYQSGSTLVNDGGCDMEVEYFLNNKVGQPMADIHMNTPKYILDGATLNIIV